MRKSKVTEEPVRCCDQHPVKLRSYEKGKWPDDLSPLAWEIIRTLNCKTINDLAATPAREVLALDDGELPVFNELRAVLLLNGDDFRDIPKDVEALLAKGATA